jgi:hypothetical protein
MFCALLLFAVPLFVGITPSTAAASLSSAPAGSSIQSTLGHPLQLGPWKVLVEQPLHTEWQGIPALAVPVTLRNTSSSTQPLDSARLFTCYRNDVWQSLNLLGGEPLPQALIAPGKATSGRLIYQLPPDVLKFGLVFFWQSNGSHATGIWLLTLH